MRYTPAELEAAATRAAEIIQDIHGLWPEFELRQAETELIARLCGEAYRTFELEDDEEDTPDVERLAEWLSEDPDEAAGLMRAQRLAELELGLPALEAALAADPALRAIEDLSCEVEALGFWPRARHEIEQEYARGYPPYAVIIRDGEGLEVCVEIEEDEIDVEETLSALRHELSVEG